MQTCKSWTGPCTTQDELEKILASNPSIQKKIVKVELTYYWYTHKPEVIARPDLFKLNKITHEERLKNFLILLSDVDDAAGTVADLPTNENVLKAIKATSIENVTTHTIKYVSEFNVNDLCVVDNSKLQWFLAYIKEQVSEEEYVVNHLVPLKERNDSRWKYPATDDTRTIHLEQLLNVKVEGD